MASMRTTEKHREPTTENQYTGSHTKQYNILIFNISGHYCEINLFSFTIDVSAFSLPPEMQRKVGVSVSARMYVCVRENFGLFFCSVDGGCGQGRAKEAAGV